MTNSFKTTTSILRHGNSAFAAVRMTVQEKQKDELAFGQTMGSEPCRAVPVDRTGLCQHLEATAQVESQGCLIAPTAPNLAAAPIATTPIRPA